MKFIGYTVFLAGVSSVGNFVGAIMDRLIIRANQTNDGGAKSDTNGIDRTRNAGGAG